VRRLLDLECRSRCQISTFTSRVLVKEIFGPEAFRLILPKPVAAPPLVSVNVSAFADLKTNRQTTALKSTRNM